jgi:LuxR family quorum sensing-dependent transcriptional regulator
MACQAYRYGTPMDRHRCPKFGAAVFSFIDSLDRLSDTNEVLRVLEGAVARFGFERLLFTGLLPIEGERFDDVVLASGWPPEFLQLYCKHDYIRFDPIARLARQSANPFIWEGPSYFRSEETGVAAVMKHAADFGITRGFIVPIHGPAGYAACVSMSGVDVDLPAKLTPGLHLMAQYSFNRIWSLVAPLRKTPCLTRREREVLTWAAKGKSAWEIGEILAISKRTVDEHAYQAFRKLGAVNRTQAVAMAVRNRLISI